MLRLINSVISVLFTFIKLNILKIFHFKNLKFRSVERFSPNVVLEMELGAKVSFENRIRIHSGSKIKVRKNASLFIGENVAISYNNIIVCHDSICIGNGTEIGPNVCVYDHDHDYKKGLKKELFKTSPVKIGKNCWIGAGTIILRGTEIGDNCVIAAGSIVKGKFKENSIIYNKIDTVVRHYEVL